MSRFCFQTLFLSRRRSIVGVTLGAAIILAQPLPAQRLEVRATDQRRAPSVATAVATSDAIVIDGRLSEETWQRAPMATDFVQREPLEGASATERTEVRVAFDAKAIFIGARLYERNPKAIVRQVVRRDEQGQYDWFEVGLNPSLDRRTGYIFRVSSSNVQRDEYLFDDRERDTAWDAVWSSAVQVDSLGWSVEIRIPLSQLRYTASPRPQSWGVNFARRRVANNEETQFALISRLQQGIISQYGTLDGIVIPRAPRRLELRPYGVGGVFLEPREPGNPFADGSSTTSRTGLDLRYGLGAQFTVDATVNPDFGQVEADPAVINLTAFETFFEERRPFFVEDARIFDFTLSGGRNRLFYSRRVGRSPTRSSLSGAAFSDVPDAATILGAAKMTGRTKGGLSLGAIAAVTQQETGRAYFDDTNSSTSFVAEPRTGYGVLRLRQDYAGGASTFGAIATALARDLPSDGTFDFLPRTAFSLGTDWEHQWSDRSWAFFGYVAASHIRGDSTALLRVQRSSQHYFQRPDALRLRVDSSATSMTGVDWRMTLERRRGRHWTGSIWAAQVTPGFEVNDLGFSGRQEVLDGGVRVTYRELTPGTHLRSYEMSVFTFHNWTHDVLEDVWSAASWGRGHVSGSVTARGQVQLLNYWELEGNVSLRPELVDRTATRGGPLMLNPRGWETRLTLRTDRRKVISFSPFVVLDRRSMGAQSRMETGVDMTYRPSSRVQMSLRPQYESGRTGAQYVATTSAVPFQPTLGRRYLFGELERREVSLETRLNVAFSPHLSLQVYAQPFLSSGDYVAYKQLLAPQSYDFDVFEEGSYTGGRCASGRTCVDPSLVRHFDFNGDGTSDYSFGDKDFNVRSLIGNAVVRWEYRPGSTIFFVWQRQQRNEASIGTFDWGRDTNALFGAPASNTFLIKASYWIGL